MIIMTQLNVKSNEKFINEGIGLGASPHPIFSLQMKKL